MFFCLFFATYLLVVFTFSSFPKLFFYMDKLSMHFYHLCVVNNTVLCGCKAKDRLTHKHTERIQKETAEQRREKPLLK